VIDRYQVIMKCKEKKTNYRLMTTYWKLHLLLWNWPPWKKLVPRCWALSCEKTQKEKVFSSLYETRWNLKWKKTKDCLMDPFEDQCEDPSRILRGSILESFRGSL
jgi:hypothetical protein